MVGREILFLVFTSTCTWLCVSTSQKRLVLHSDLDIKMVVDELRREINATKQENAAIKVQMSQENAAMKVQIGQEITAIETQMAKENAAIKAQLTNGNAAIEAQITQINATTQAQMAQENAAIQAQLAQENTDLKAEIEILRKGQSSTYIRWGRTVCDGNGTEKVYKGYAAGSPYDIAGGAASFICLPETPSWALYTDGIQGIGGYVSGVEYQGTADTFGKTVFGKKTFNDDAPCVVCRAPRPTTLMIPGSTTCYSGWTLEYTGYLMTGAAGHNGGTDYACVDKHPEAELHGEADQDGKLFYFAEVKCGSLPCQEYPDGRELACVVCSK